MIKSIISIIAIIALVATGDLFPFRNFILGLLSMYNLCYLFSSFSITIKKKTQLRVKMTLQEAIDIYEEKYNYIVLNCDGFIYYSAEELHLIPGVGWQAEDINCRTKKCLFDIDTTGIKWNESLTKRSNK